MSGIPKTYLTRAGWTGVKSFELMLKEIDGCRDKDGELKHEEARTLVCKALVERRGADELEGFAIALAEYLGVIADGAVPDPGHIARCLKHGEFADDWTPKPGASAEVNLAIRRILGE